MKYRKPTPGSAGWLAIGVVVAVAELTDSRTMSDYFTETARKPVRGPVMGLFYAALGAHLFGLIPRKYDPFHQLARRTFARGRYDG